MKQRIEFSDCGESPVARWGFLRALAVLVAATGTSYLLVLGVVTTVAANVGRETFHAAMALGICLAGGILGLIVIFGSRGTIWEAWSAIVAMGIRMLVTLLFVIAFLLLSEGLVTARFLLYVIVFYVVIMWFETFLSLRRLKLSSVAAKTGSEGTSGVDVRGRQPGDLDVSSQDKD